MVEKILSMAHHSIFSKCLRFARVFSQPTEEGLASHLGIQKQLFSTRVILPTDSTVSYLVNSCGLSPESAALVSHKVKLPSLDKPNSVLTILKLYEFSDTQISELVRRRPLTLLNDVKKTLLPKLEFYSSIGISRLDLARTLSYNPWLLCGSLENHMVPTCTFLKSMLLSDVKLVYILNYKSYILTNSVSKNVIQNVELLRKLGMSQSYVALLLTTYTHIVVIKPELFRQLVGEVTDMGFVPDKTSFVEAMHVLTRKETWKRCQEAYRRWGWSENHVLSAFRSCPLSMTKSHKKIMGTMDFLVNKMGWHSHKIAKFPNVFLYSLEKRIIPRCSVVRVLLLKGLIKEEKLSLATVFTKPDNYFLNSFVNRYLHQVPQLLNVYQQGKLEFEDL